MKFLSSLPVIMVLVLLQTGALSAQDDSCLLLLEARGGGKAGDLAVLLGQSYREAVGCTEARFQEKTIEVSEYREKLDSIMTKIRGGRNSPTFIKGAEELAALYLEAKGLLSEMDAALVAEIYKLMAMEKAARNEGPLASAYVVASLNMDPRQTPMSFSYTEDLKQLYAGGLKAINEAAKTKVSITSTPPGAEIIVDGRSAGRTPLEAELASGQHLVQARLQGYRSIGWIKGIEEAPWNMRLEALPVLGRLEKARTEILANLESKQKPAKGKEPEPLCQEKPMVNAASIFGAKEVLAATVTEKDGKLVYHGCRLQDGKATEVGAEIPIDGTLPKNLREQFPVAPKAAAAPAAQTAVLPGKSAVPPILEVLQKTRTAVQGFVQESAAKKRAFRDLGMPEQIRKIAVFESSAMELLGWLSDAEANYGKDKNYAMRLIFKAEQTWNRMSDTVISLRSLDPEKYRLQAVEADNSKLVPQCLEKNKALAKRWKTDRRKVKDRALLKLLDKDMKAANAGAASLAKPKKGKAVPPTEIKAAALQCSLDADVLSRKIDLYLSGQQKPAKVEPDVEPESAKKR